VRSALDDVQVARRSLETAEARVRAARETFRLTSRRHDAGRANQIERTDARTTRTEAELNLNRTRYTLLIRLAELDYALGNASVDM
jgi:outer membrane protein